MKKILSTIMSITILMLIAVSPVSAEFKYEEKGDFLYIHNGTYLTIEYKKSSSNQEISRIEFPAEYKGMQVNEIGFTTTDDDYKAKNLKVNTIFIPKTVKEFQIYCVDYPEYDAPDRFISVRNIEVDKDNPYLCSKDGVLYSKDMKIMYLYPNRNSMTVYKMPNTVEEVFGFVPLFKRNNLKKIYLSDNLERISSVSLCKNLEYVYIGKNTKEIESSAFSNNNKLKTVKIKSKKLKAIGALSFYNCPALKKINIPSTVKTIGEGAFWKCKSLKKVTLPENLEIIDFSAFADCKNLSTVTIKNKKKAPKIKKHLELNLEIGAEYKKVFEGTKEGIKFYVKNKKVAKSLKKQLKGSGVKKAKIYVGKTLVYKNIK